MSDDIGAMPRANPPISIPPFNNVPAPGSPIRSDWPQQITTYVSTNIPALTANQPNFQGVAGIGGTSGGTFASIQSLAVGPKALAGYLYCWSILRLDITTTGSTSYNIALRNNTTILAQYPIPGALLVNGTIININLSAVVAIAANGSANINLFGSGTANVKTYGDATVNYLNTLFLPNPM